MTAHHDWEEHIDEVFYAWEHVKRWRCKRCRAACYSNQKPTPLERVPISDEEAQRIIVDSIDERATCDMPLFNCDGVIIGKIMES